MKYLIIVAHPDDEVLGAGASIYRLAKEGHDIYICILSGEVSARDNRPEVEKLHLDIKEAVKVLGVKKVILGSFPNIKFNTVPHLELVHFIEKTILDYQPKVIITHHPADLNNDHLHTSQACQAALRIFQRREIVNPIQELLYMEVLSSTDWNLNHSMNPFIPNTYIEVGEVGMKHKLQALEMYSGVMRNYPHPRSEETILGLAAYRGSQAGVQYAEAFETAIRVSAL